MGEQQRLAAQEVEVLRGRGRVDYPQIFLGRQLQKAFQPRRRMVWPLPLVAVRQQQDQRWGLVPLRSPRDEILVNHHLRRIDKVAKLRLPQHQMLGVFDVVAVLKANRGTFGEWAVVNLERGAGVGQMLQGGVFCTRFGIKISGVAMAKGSPLHIFARQADGCATRQNGGKSE